MVEMRHNTLLPAWYDIEKENLREELASVAKVAITSDGWTSITQDHYITVTLHNINQGQLKKKVLKTQAVYESQSGPVVAEQIDEVLAEFGVRQKVVAITVDNAPNMDVAVRQLQTIKLGCFAHTLNLGAQKLYNVQAISKWSARIRDVIVWIKRSSIIKTIFKEKQRLLGLPDHSVVLDVKTRWNSLYLMVERSVEQYHAIQAAFLDPCAKKLMKRDRLEQITDEDFRRAEDFISLMRMLYTSTLCVSSDKSSACGQIIPILQKLKTHLTIKEEDSTFVATVKEKFWGDLSKRYQDHDIMAFLEEATLMDPRFKGKLSTDEVWERLKAAALREMLGEEDAVPVEAQEVEEDEKEEEEEVENRHVVKKPRVSALEEFFAEDDKELRRSLIQKQKTAPTILENIRNV